MTGRDLLFGAFGLICAAAAILSVTTRQVVHAALWLVVTLGTLAACYLVLGAELVALVQLLVYVGAVVVLVLFALMLTRAPIGRSGELDTGRTQRILAAVVAAGTAVLLGVVLVSAVGGAPVATTAGDARTVAVPLFESWVWPFELLSLLLLLALVAAFAVARMPVTGADQPYPPGADPGADPTEAIPVRARR